MFFDVFQMLCKRRGKSPTGVGLELGIAKTTVSGWKNRGNVPSGDVLQKIADYFDVSVDFLITGDKEKEPPAGDSVDPRQSMHDRIDNMTDEEYQRFVEILKLVSPDRFKEE